MFGPGGLIIDASVDTTLSDVPPGEYTVTWQAVPHWTTPESQTQILMKGENLEFFGEYSDYNLFDEIGFGDEATLEVMTWNIEHFPKNGTVTVDYVIQIIEGLDVDIIALQEIESLSYFQQLREGLAEWTGDRATSASYSINLAFLYPVNGPAQVSAVYEILTDYSLEFPRSPYVLEGTFQNNLRF